MKRTVIFILLLVCGSSCAYATRYILTENNTPITTEGAVRLIYDPPSYGILTEANIHLITENKSRLVVEDAP